VFVAIYAPGALIYIGPFAGMAGVYASLRALIYLARRRGATDTEVIDVQAQREVERELTPVKGRLPSRR
jgi:hypothetical protein